MPALFKPPFYPIVYVRGYAATMGEIENTVATPYMGFNTGSTKLRQDFQGLPVKFVFESPLIRLMKEFKYEDCYEGGDYRRHPSDGGRRVAARSIWVFRYYEPVSQSLGDGERLTIPEFAADLRAFILQVRRAICGAGATAARGFKVNLVAHSMGGLICRCYLQNICRYGIDWERPQAGDPGNGELELTKTGGPSYVNKVFTYGTPHNGIEFQGVNVPDVRSFDAVHVRNFNRDYMAKYLRLSDGGGAGHRVNSLDGAFDPGRFFCFVGTNYRDYEAFFGVSKRATGPMSDGLVMCQNAYVDGAPRAFVHRAHSGEYGIVNSEEGYQNLRRFLFGDIRVDVCLEVDELTLPLAIQRKFGLDKVETQAARRKIKREIGRRLKAAYYIESSAQVRGGNVKLHERRVDHESAVLRTYDELTDPARRRSVYLFSGFLDSSASTKSAGQPLAFSVRVAVKVPLFEIDKRFWFDDHFEGANIFEETFTLFLKLTGKQARVTYGLGNEDGAGEAQRTDANVEACATGGILVGIPLGFTLGAAAENPGKLRGRLTIQACRETT